MSLSNQDLRERIARIFKLLKDDDPHQRQKGFTRLHDEAAMLHDRMSSEDFEHLIERIASEPNAALRQTGMLASIKLALLAARAAPEPVEVEPSRHLGDWLWGAFKEKSAVVSVVDSELYRRDEPAEVQVFRRLSFDDFPLTEQEHIFLAHQHTHVALPGSYKAVCVIGRPGLLGPGLLDAIRYRAETVGDESDAQQMTRFGFDVHRRPKDLPRNKIDSRYHYILERPGNGKPVKHQTADDGVQRIDYGIVQRYAIDFSGTKVVIVVCAAHRRWAHWGPRRGPACCCFSRNPRSACRRTWRKTAAWKRCSA